MPFRPGERLGEYEVQRLLGRGAHGVVLLVRGPGRCEQTHAMKLLHCDGPPALGNAARNARDAAFAEAAMLRRLRHPHVVGCRDVAWDPERQVVRLLLEYMDGGDLQGLIEARRDVGEHFEAHFARRVLAAVGGALAYIHSAGILHRDVKPANVLLTSNSQRIKLADFGIAKLLEHTNKAHTVVGTPYYLSPEIVAGQAYGEASDGWALGVCLYEVMALRRPFDAGNQLALVRRICTEGHDPLPDTAPPDVRRAAEGLLAKDTRLRMSVTQALGVSSAVAALTVVGTPPELEDTAASVARDGAVVADLGPENSRRPSASGAVEQQSWKGGDDSGEPVTPRTGKQPPRPLDSPAGSLCSSWAASQGVELMCSSSFLAFADEDEGADQRRHAGDGSALDATWCRSQAAVAAREALCNDVDDPEELVHALAALERERGAVAEQRPGPESASEASALDALESELRLRISALKEDAAAMLDGLFGETMTGTHKGSKAANGLSLMSPSSCVKPADQDLDGRTTEEEDSPSAADEDSGTDAVSTSPLQSMRVRGRAPGASEIESVLEVATSLGVDTNQSEERIAHRRGMLSLRVKWGSVARFCMLPITVGFDSLVAEVSRRFGLGHGTALPPLSWCEAGESFELESQASWEECLQRRGLVNHPGRLELYVRSDEPPPRPAHLHRVPRPYSSVAASAALPFSNTMRRPDLFTWRTPSQTALQSGTAGGTAAGRRNLGRANRTPLAARSSSRCRETVGTSVAPAAIDPPVDSEEDHAEASAKVQRTFRNDRDRLRAQSVLQEELFTAATESRCSVGGVPWSRGYGTLGSLSNLARGYGMEFNRSSPTGATATFHRGQQRGLTADCNRWSPTGEPPTSLSAQIRESTGITGSGLRPSVRCSRQHREQVPRSRGGARTSAAGATAYWTGGGAPGSRTLATVGQAVGNGLQQQPGGNAGISVPLPVVSGRAVPR